MNNEKRAQALLKWYGSTPERCTVYPIPEWSPVRLEGSYKRNCKTSSGEVAIFEFGFPVPHFGNIPWNDLDESLQHHCKTCEWDFCRGKGTPYCSESKEITDGECASWMISPDEIGTATAEYYRQLHEKHYGPCGVVISPSAK